MKIPILRINQNNNQFFIGKIKVKSLAQIATNKIRRTYTKQNLKGYFDEIDQKISHKINEGNIWYLKDTLSDSNIQREQSKSRIKEIGEYLEKQNTVFPNSIIINLAPIQPKDVSLDLIKITENYLEFEESKVVATVIDGQHRLAGFNYIKKSKDKIIDNFELIVTIFINLDVGQQAEMFATINGKQKAVNKSILYDLTELSEEEYTELITSHLIVKWFNMNQNSPWFGRIKMLGIGEGSLSQAAFIDAMLPLFEEIDLNRKRKNSLPVLRPYFLQKDEPQIMQILLNYFNSFHELFEYQWDSKTHILTKTTGINAMLKLFPYVFCELYYNNNLEKYSEYVKILSRLSNFSFSSKKYSGGGVGIQNLLLDEMKKLVVQEDMLNLFEDKFLQFYKSTIKL